MRKRPVYTLQKPHCISSPSAQVVTSDSGFPAPAICNEHPEIIQGPPIVTGPPTTLRNPPERDNVTKAGDVSR